MVHHFEPAQQEAEQQRQATTLRQKLGLAELAAALVTAIVA
jgi:hypothetical protein